METRNITLTLEQAKEWYNSDNEVLKEVVLQAFTEDELKFDFRNIKTFCDAHKYLVDNDLCKDLIYEYQVALSDSYSEKICKYRIIVAALTNNEKRYLTTGELWFPVVQFCELGKEKNYSGNKIIGTIESEGQRYSVAGGRVTYSSIAGLGCFYSSLGVSNPDMSVSFQLVSSKEIAEHISKYFGRLLFEIQYGGTNCNWKWIDS